MPLNGRNWSPGGRKKHSDTWSDGCTEPWEAWLQRWLKPREVRQRQIQPGIEWEKVWNNLHSIPTSEVARSAWYMVPHDLLSTNTGLHRIRLVETEDYTLCGKKDTTVHRITECGGVGEEISEWTRIRLAAIHRTVRRPFPLVGSWGPVPDFGHDNDIWRHCGSRRTSYST